MSAWTWPAAEILLNALWIAPLAYVAARAVCGMPHATPRIRAAVSLAALAAAVALPALQRIDWPSPPLPQAPAAVATPPAWELPGIDARPTPSTAASSLQIQAGPLVEAIVRIWALGSLCGIAVLAFGIASALRLKWRARNAAGEWEKRERLWAADAPRRARLMLSGDVDAPVAVGWRRPAVLFPSRLAETLEDHELGRLWLHEAAHLERRDDWLVLLERVCLSVLWFHPVAWALSRRVAVEREMACDLLAAERSGSRRDYARTLTRLAELRIARRAAPALSIAGESSLSRRIQMLLHDRPSQGGRLGRAGLTLAATACAAATVGVLTIGPLIALAQSPPEPPSAPASPASPASPPSLPAPPSAPGLAGLASPPTPPQAAPAPAPSANSKPAPPPKPPAAPAPAAKPHPRAAMIDRETQEEIRALSQEIRQMSEEIQRQVQVELKPLHEKMQAVGDEMRQKSEPFAEKIRDLAWEIAKLHLQSPLTEEQQREIEAKSQEMAKQSRELEEAMQQLQERMESLQIEVKPNEETIRAIEEKVRAKTAEIEKRIQEKMERREEGPHQP